MLKKYKTVITIFLGGFLFYFLLGTVLSYYLGTANFWNVLFDLDTPRVLGDLSLIDYNHYRTSVHPLFVICFQPIVLILNKIINDPIIAVVLIQSVLSSITLAALYTVLKKIGLNKKICISLLIIFGVSFGQFVFSASIETYIFAQFFLVLLWLFAAFKIDKKFNFWDYVILTVLGIGSIAVTLTNFFQFLIVVFFLICLNKKINNRWWMALIIVLCSGAFSVVLAEVQNVFWPSAPNFFSKNISDFLYGTSEEKLYISRTIGISNFLNVFNASFAYSFNIANFTISTTGTYLTFDTNLIINVISVIMALCFSLLNIYFMVKTKFNMKKHKLYYALVITYLFNMLLHLIYGNTISFIYVCHFNFIFILILAYLLNYFEFKILNSKIFFVVLTSIFVLLSLKNIMIMFVELFPLYNTVQQFRILPIAIICITLILLILISIKNKLIKTILIIFTVFCSIGSWFILNQKEETCVENCSVMELYQASFDKYEYQLKDMKNTFSVSNYSNREEPIGIFYFGMADRRKMLYKDGKIIDIKTQEVIKNIDYQEEMIVPNEYTVLLKNDDDIYKIYEDEEGVFIEKNGVIETLSTGNKKINLPEFDSNKYSEVLKVVHQEILFNIDGDVPKPNLIGYDEAWYRDTMLATMVLEHTDNVNLLVNWLETVDSIYDYSRSPFIQETDNLGELLYIIGAVGIDRDDLVLEILNEIDNIKRDDGSIGGNIDGYYQTYYPTALVLNAAKKLGIEVDLVMPNYDDGYAKLTWYYNKDFYTKAAVDTRFYPYLNWAFYNYSGYGSLYVLDEIYPLSYEGGDTSTPGRVEAECFISEYYCNQQLYISHMWHASEMFLYLMNF